MDREKPTSTQSYTEGRTCDFCIFFIFTPFLSMSIALHATHSAVTCERDTAFESFLVIDLFAISPVDALFPSRVGGHLETNLRLRVRGKGFVCLCTTFSSRTSGALFSWLAPYQSTTDFNPVLLLIFLKLVSISGVAWQTGTHSKFKRAEAGYCNLMGTCCSPNELVPWAHGHPTIQLAILLNGNSEAQLIGKHHPVPKMLNP